MELRNELTPRPIAPETLRSLADQLDNLISRMDVGSSYAAELAAFNTAL